MRGIYTNAGYTLLKSKIAKGYFFRFMGKFFLPYIASELVVFSVLRGQEQSVGHVEIAATGGA